MATAPQVTHRYLVRFDDPACRDPHIVGSKAATLAELASAGFAVPEAVVLTTTAFTDALDALVAAEESTVGSAPLSASVEQALLRVAAQFGDAALAVRSSCVAEDLAGSSFAGQYETVLGVRGPEQLVDAVRRCWASTFSARVQAYRRQQAFDRPAPMAVILQRQIDADAAGVAFSADPVTGDRAVMVINAVRGLGDAFVGGEVTPEEWRFTDRESRRTSADDAVLDADQAKAVADLTAAVQVHAGVPQDIEWALEGGRLWLLQARPITGLPRQPVQSVPVPVETPEGYWERDASHWPDPVSPLQRSLLYPCSFTHARHFLAEFGMLADRIELRDIGGWHYYRIVPLGGQDRKPPPAWLGRVAAKLYPPMRRRVKAAIEARRTDKAGRFLRQWYEEWMPALEEGIDRLKGVDLESLTDADLAGHLDAVVALKDEGIRVHTLVVGVQMVELYGLARACRELLGWDDARMFDLLVGLSERSTEPARRLAELTAMAAARPVVRDLLQRTDDGTPDRLAATDPVFAAAFEDYRTAYGYQGLSRDLTDPTMAERPALLLRLIANQLTGGFDAASTNDANRRQREAALGRARRELAKRPPEDRQRFESALQRAQQAYPLREDNVFYTLFGPDGLLRLAALAVARRMTARGQIDDPEDIFFLEYAELREAFASGDDSHELIERRMGERAWVETHPGPSYYGTPPGPPPPLDFLPAEARYAMEALLWTATPGLMWAIGNPEGNSGARISGMSASAGRYTGTVRLIRREAEFGKLRAGDVLVCPITSPTWSVLFPSIGALVTDSGGILNHPAIIAREYRVPAVVGTGNATELLRDGQTVTVDGSAGVVHLAGAVDTPAAEVI